MKIDSAVVNLTANSSRIETFTKDESIKFWTGDIRPNSEEGETSKGISDTVDLSKEGMQMFYDGIDCSKSNKINKEEDGYSLSDRDKQKIALIEKFIEALTGKKIKIHIMDKLKIKDGNIGFNLMSRPIQIPQNNNRKSWGLEVDSVTQRYQQEKVSFNADAVIKTGDGREIKFSLDIKMSQESYEKTEMHLRAGDVKIDPLVINYNGNFAKLDGANFEFDLDSDGKKEQLNFLGKGSGFLAIDKNSDGIINDGKELFGPQTNNGFSELAKYDLDGNSWIDENDEIFDKLRIWTKDEQGNDKLFALGEKGVGAIFLGNVSTPYSIKDNNETQGVIQKTGVYVNENGSAGTIQHVDYVV